MQEKNIYIIFMFLFLQTHLFSHSEIFESVDNLDGECEEGFKCSSLGECTKIKETYFSKKSIQRYLKHLETHEKNREAHFMRDDIRSIKIFTDEDVVARLMGLFV